MLKMVINPNYKKLPVGKEIKWFALVTCEGEFHKGKRERVVDKRQINKNIGIKYCASCGKKGENHPLFGTHPSKKTRLLWSKQRSGKNNPMYGVKSPMKGRKHSEEAKFKISESRRGSKHWRWNPNLTTEERERGRRNITKFKEWAKRVKQRDDYTCQISGVKGGRLTSHHLNSWTSFPKQRYILNNGITLREDIHKLFHTIYGNCHNTKNQFLEFKKYIKNILK